MKVVAKIRKERSLMWILSKCWKTRRFDMLGDQTMSCEPPKTCSWAFWQRTRHTRHDELCGQGKRPWGWLGDMMLKGHVMKDWTLGGKCSIRERLELESLDDMSMFRPCKMVKDMRDGPEMSKVRSLQCDSFVGSFCKEN